MSGPDASLGEMPGFLSSPARPRAGRADVGRGPPRAAASAGCAGSAARGGGNGCQPGRPAGARLGLREPQVLANVVYSSGVRMREVVVIRTRLRITIAGVGAAALALSGWAVLGGAASAAPEASTPGPIMVTARLAPSIPSDPNIFRVTAGGVPWKITQGVVALHTDGLLTATINGLVVPPGNKNPLPDLALAVFCNGPRGATTPTVTCPARRHAH